MSWKLLVLARMAVPASLGLVAAVRLLLRRPVFPEMGYWVFVMPSAFAGNLR